MKIKKRFLGFLLSLALVLGLMPGMSLTALADAPEGIEVLNEDFSVGIPSTWSISQGTYRFEAKDGYVWADPSNGSYKEEAFCYSPAVDLSKAATAKLIFKYKKPQYSYWDGPHHDFGSDDLYVYYITNGTYNELWSDYNEDGIDEWTQVTIELPSGAFKEGVQIAFKAINWKDLGAFFDDVSIYYKKSITATAENTVVPYDGEAHGITVSVIEPVVDQKEYTPKAEVEGLDEELATNVMTDDEKNKVKIDASTGFYSGLKISQKNGKIKVSWDKGEDASKYAVYAAYCGNKFASKPVKTTKSTSATFKKINGKKIDFSKKLKIYVTAYDASGKKIGNTVSAHFAGKNNKKYKNPKAVKLTTTALTIEVGKSAKVKASVKMESGKEIALGDAHCAKLRYKTTNEKIATVDKNGNVTGVAAGTCEVYVYSKNGLAKKCTVTVK
ncbi:Ig-like domain-containing protein [Ruminococcus sp.]|uniref:Ig-like domain-containing protein n=1 Tax=Ruminococcus sp. TaxID=41978 RepID=UPI0025DB8842|nr:Ig-like domain-containing protein [Ruminococcus sp.]